MTIKRHYYSLLEVSKILDLTIDELMHYGITGQLGMCFDWALIKSEISINNLPLKLTLEFQNHPRHQWQSAVNDTLASDHKDYPNGRLFPLSTELLSVIFKQGFIKLEYAFDDFDEVTLKIIKLDGDEQTEYPSLKLSDIVITSISYANFVKKNKLNKPVEDAAYSVKEAFDDESVPNKLYFAFCLNKEVWPVADNMNLPSQIQLEQLIMQKDPDLNQADIESIIRLSTPDNINRGGKQKKDKVDFVPVNLRNN